MDWLLPDSFEAVCPHREISGLRRRVGRRFLSAMERARRSRSASLARLPSGPCSAIRNWSSAKTSWTDAIVVEEGSIADVLAIVMSAR